MLTFQAKSVEDLKFIADEIILRTNYSVLCFHGDLGSGKTTLIKEILKKLEVLETTSSPTFSIVNKYNSVSGKTFYHFDFYRISSEKEAFDIGLEEYLDSNNFCLIEWPEKIKDFLPNNYHKISINAEMNNRTITFE